MAFIIALKNAYQGINLTNEVKDFYKINFKTSKIFEDIRC